MYVLFQVNGNGRAHGLIIWRLLGLVFQIMVALPLRDWQMMLRLVRSSFRVWFVEAIPQALRLLAVGRKYWFKDNTWHSVCWELGANECVFVRGRRQIAVALCVSRAKVTQKHETQRCRF